MAKIAKYVGPSYTEEEVSGMVDYDPVPINRAEHGGVPSDNQGGKGSSQRSGTAETSDKEPSAGPRKPALTTESPSRKEEEEPSDVSSTDGSGRATKAQPSGKRTAKKANTRVASDEDDDF